MFFMCDVFFSSRRRHTSCALVTGVQTCALPICAAPDHYGGDERKDMSYYGESVVALDSRSSAVRWHFQTVHHDLWDYDLAAQPVTYLHDGKTPAVIAATKLGFVFLLDRLTGKQIGRAHV